MQASLSHQLLPLNNKRNQKRYFAAIVDPVPPNSCTQDTLYLTPIIKEIEAEQKEREDLEVMVPKTKNRT